MVAKRAGYDDPLPQIFPCRVYWAMPCLSTRRISLNAPHDEARGALVCTLTRSVQAPPRDNRQNNESPGPSQHTSRQQLDFFDARTMTTMP